ncbi:MAG: InlB B-repeat-containing protein, partial [Clostridia bacterium]|nr:InlB B-repeat-containing protein [Clostridia bacterium]
MKKLFTRLIGLTVLLTVFLGLASCGKDVEFNVNFIVDGETYATVGTGGEEVIKIPENPTKDGYTFEGWYWDKDTWQTPFTANSLLDAPLSSDMNVYAKWKENEPPLPDLQGVEIRSKALTLTEDTLKVTLSNATETFSFLNDITVADGASYVIARDIGCEQTVASKTVSLEAGDNVYYILVTNGNEQKLYTATVRRRPMYTVSFNTNGGTAVASQTVEEDSLATTPTTTRAGYTFASWNYDFSQPVISSVTVSASWNANTNTPYKVEYYLENLDKNGYDKVETLNLTGTTDTTANAEIRTYEHFTYYSYRSNVSGNIDGNGTRILRVYYTRNTYTVTTSVSDSNGGSITGGGVYPYGKSVTITVTPSPIYNHVSFNVNGITITDTTSYTFTVSANTTVSATLEIDNAAVQALDPFTYTTTSTTCLITGIKDKTVKNIVVPDFVTNINEGAFSGC